MSRLDEIDFFTDAALINDPYPYFESLRTKCPVLHEPHHGVAMVTGYDEAMEVLNTARTAFCSAVTVTGPLPPLPFEPKGDDITAQLRDHMEELPWSAHIVTRDGPEHVNLRTMITGALTQSRLRKNEEYIATLVDRLIDKLIDRGRCEFVSEYSHALSTLVIADLLGVPEEDRDELIVLLGPAPTQIDGSADYKMGPDPLSLLEERFTKYMQARRGAPRDDMLSDLANAKFRDGTLPDLAVPVRLAKFLFGAGQDTSARLVATCFRILGERPDLQAYLRAHPDRIPDFIEESLRIEAPTKAISRLATKTTEVGGVCVHAGTVTTLGLGAANRDPRKFERPDEFNMDRANVRDHLSFSRGPHACPGAPLARVETRVTLERFLARTKDIRLDEERHGPAGNRRYDYEPTYLLRGLSNLHIEWTKA
jgi:cytochrome P450